MSFKGAGFPGHGNADKLNLHEGGPGISGYLVLVSVEPGASGVLNLPQFLAEVPTEVKPKYMH